MKTSVDEELRMMAEAHWDFTRRLMMLWMDIVGFIYVETFMHGAGHGWEARGYVGDDKGKDTKGT